MNEQKLHTCKEDACWKGVSACVLFPKGLVSPLDMRSCIYCVISCLHYPDHGHSEIARSMPGATETEGRQRNNKTPCLKITTRDCGFTTVFVALFPASLASKRGLVSLSNFM